MNRRLMLMPLVLVALGACQGTERGENATADSVAAAPAPSAMDADVERAVAVYRGKTAFHAPEAALEDHPMRAPPRRNRSSPPTALPRPDSTR